MPVVRRGRRSHHGKQHCANSAELCDRRSSERRRGERGRSTGCRRRGPPGVLAPASHLHRSRRSSSASTSSSTGRCTGPTTWPAGSTTSSLAPARTSCTRSVGWRSLPVCSSDRPETRRLCRRRLAVRDRRQPADRGRPGVLRHRPARLRAHARGPDLRPPRARGRSRAQVRSAARSSVVARGGGATRWRLREVSDARVYPSGRARIRHGFRDPPESVLTDATDPLFEGAKHRCEAIPGRGGSGELGMHARANFISP